MYSVPFWVYLTPTGFAHHTYCTRWMYCIQSCSYFNRLLFLTTHLAFWLSLYRPLLDWESLYSYWLLTLSQSSGSKRYHQFSSSIKQTFRSDERHISKNNLAHLLQNLWLNYCTYSPSHPHLDCRCLFDKSLKAVYCSSVSHRPHRRRLLLWLPPLPNLHLG